MAKKPSHRDDEGDSNDDGPVVEKPAADPNAPPPELTQAEKDEGKEPLPAVEAEQLLRAGHRLRRKGDDPSKWIAMTRHSGEMALSVAATEDKLKAVLEEDLLLADS